MNSSSIDNSLDREGPRSIGILLLRVVVPVADVAVLHAVPDRALLRLVVIVHVAVKVFLRGFHCFLVALSYIGCVIRDWVYFTQPRKILSAVFFTYVAESLNIWCISPLKKQRQQIAKILHI